MPAFTPRIAVSTPRLQQHFTPRANDVSEKAPVDAASRFHSVLQNLQKVHNAEMQLHCTIQNLSKQLTMGRPDATSQSNALSAVPPCPQHHPEPVWDEMIGISSEVSFADVTSSHYFSMDQLQSDERLDEDNALPKDPESLHDVFFASEELEPGTKLSSCMKDSGRNMLLLAEDSDPKFSSSFTKAENASVGFSSLNYSGNLRSSLAVSRPSWASTNSSDERFEISNTLDEEMLRKKTAISTKSCERETRHRVRHLLDQDTLSDLGGENSRVRQKLWRLANSAGFEVCFSAVVILNSFFLGFRFEASLSNPGERDHILIRLIEYVFTIMFTVELAIRLLAEGFEVYCNSRKCHWFYLDTFVVITSLFEIIYEQWASNNSAGGVNITNARTLRIVRIIRIVRGVRIARLVRFVRALRTLVLSIMHTLKSVLWSFLLLFLIIYVFGLIFAQVVNDHALSSGSYTQLLYMYWGNLPRSMLTLYKTISGGLSWHDCITPLSDVSGFLVALFVVYVSFTVFAVLNVITGIFCEAAIESSRKDNEMMIQQHLSEKENFTKAVCELFGVKSGEDVSLSYGEFEDVLTHPNTSAYLAAIQLDITDAWELFKLLDTDESALIDVEEFVHGCLRLKGTAKAIDVAKLDYETKIRQKRLVKHMVAVEKKLNKIMRYISASFGASSSIGGSTSG